MTILEFEKFTIGINSPMPVVPEDSQLRAFL